jgi:formylglycine-generating enzyme
MKTFSLVLQSTRTLIPLLWAARLVWRTTKTIKQSTLQTMKTQTQIMKLSLGAVALGICVAAQAAAPFVTNITMVGATPRFGVLSDLGITNQIQFCTNLSQRWWLALTNVVVAQSPYWLADAVTPPSPQKFYRARVVGPTPSGMVLIPAGSFAMGNCMTPNEGSSDELPLHTVYVSAFYMDKYPATSNLWWTVKVWNGGNGYSYDNPGSGKAGTHPVQTVSWYDVVKWCNARSQMDGLTPCYYTDSGLTVVYKSGQVEPYVKWGAKGYRLPTEAEWEKAARGGASGHRFPWSDVDTITWSRANYYAYPSLYSYDVNSTLGYHPAFATGGYPYTSPVGYFAANGYGLYDMAGNIAEWCWDWYEGSWYCDAGATQNDTRGPSSGAYRVLRGGLWDVTAGGVRCALRDRGSPTYNYFYYGFRCVRGS